MEWGTEELRVSAPAKVNLFLEVLAKRDDGFHELETLMVAISIFDSISITSNSEGRITLTCGWASGLEAKHGSSGLPPLPSSTNNLVSKAAELLSRRAGISAGATIRLTKRIPLEAGLGGASSDAAATLSALNRFWRLHWSRDQLAALAAELGSDVPFFLHQPGRGATAAVCRGRGERITPVAGLPRLHLVIAKPRPGLSTALVFRQCTVPQQVRSSAPLVDALQHGDGRRIPAAIFNRLQEIAEPLCPEVAELRRICERWEVSGHAMSGSGTSYFALCRTAHQARRLSAQLRSQTNFEVFQATTL